MYHDMSCSAGAKIMTICSLNHAGMFQVFEVLGTPLQCGEHVWEELAINSAAV